MSPPGGPAARGRGAVAVDLGDRLLVARVRESRRARRGRIVMHAGGQLEVVVPAGTRDAEVRAWLAQSRGWIARRAALAARPPVLGLDRPGVVWRHGSPLAVRLRPGTGSRARLEEGCLEIVARPGRTAAVVEGWYRREARRRIGELLAGQEARLGVASSSLAIRDPRTRWASCSRRGALSFSWRLLLAPVDVLDYVVVHELCHLHEPNHSEAFWRLVERFSPGHRAQADWLRRHGHELHAYRTQSALPG